MRRPKLETTKWSGRGDSNPRLQLGKLSYYPYTTAANPYIWSSNFYNTRIARGTSALRAHVHCAARAAATAPSECSLIDFENASRLDDWRSLLSFGEADRSFPVNVNARKLFAVVVIHGDLPMAVLASPIRPESRASLFRFSRGFLFHWASLWSREYRKFSAFAQVTSWLRAGFGSLSRVVFCKWASGAEIVKRFRRAYV